MCVFFYFRASSVCKKWKEGVKQSLGRRERLSFAGWKMDDESTSRLLVHAYSLKDLDMYVFKDYLASWIVDDYDKIVIDELL